jgi:CHAT domain
VNQMVVVRLSGVGTRRTLHVALDRSPFDLPSNEPDMPLRCGPRVLETFSEDPPQSDVVQAVGKKLFRSLGRHPTVGRAVETALAQQGGCPIYLRLDSIEAAEYPWESLFDATRRRFLALHPQWPIGRIIPAVYRASTRYLAPPVRLVAVLSATGVDAAGEWRSLSRAIEESGLDVRVRAVVGQRDLFHAIDGAHDWADVTLLSNERAVAKALTEFDPHFVHLFCHGTARPTPFVELATPTAHAALESDVQLGAVWFKDKAPMPLLATLNCCVGASDGDGVRGLASALVTEADYAAAIGMREPIEATDAHVLSASFYGAAFRRLKAVFDGGLEQEIEWASSLCDARQALRQAHAGELAPDSAAARHRRWTVPILCQAPGTQTIVPVTVHPSRDEEEKVARLKEMNALEVMRGGAKQEVQLAIAQHIARIRQELASPA